ncbi:MAG: hypothetical protein ACK559_27755, partial [bacterium]
MHHRDDQRGIDTTAQKRTERHIRHHAHANGLLQERLKLSERIRVTAAERIVEPTLHHLRQAPV